MNPIVSALRFLARNTTDTACEPNQDRFPAGTSLIGIFFLLAASGMVGAENEHKAFFYEPGSGARVTHYTIELPVERGQTQAFVIPDDCDTVLQTIDEGATYRGSIVDRRFWLKVEGDCRHHRFLHRLPQRVIEDHVTGYDFMNASLSDMPIDPRCAIPDQADCNPLATDAFGMLLHFPLIQQVTARPPGVQCAQCEFKDGVLRGRVFSDEDGIRCGAIPYGPSLRLIAVDFADINGDGFLDAVLRFVPLGPGSNRSLLTLPLTRFDESEPFTVPATTPQVPPEGR